jgi:hypothetical protein
MASNAWRITAVLERLQIVYSYSDRLENKAYGEALHPLPKKSSYAPGARPQFTCYICCCEKKVDGATIAKVCFFISYNYKECQVVVCIYTYSTGCQVPPVAHTLATAKEFRLKNTENFQKAGCNESTRGSPESCHPSPKIHQALE